MTFDPMSVEVTCVTLPKDHCVQVPWRYINVCGYSDQFCKLPHTYIHILRTYYVHTTYRMSDHIVSYWTQFRRDKKGYFLLKPAPEIYLTYKGYLWSCGRKGSFKFSPWESKMITPPNERVTAALLWNLFPVQGLSQIPHHPCFLVGSVLFAPQWVYFVCYLNPNPAQAVVGRRKEGVEKKMCAQQGPGSNPGPTAC